jgi:hypothetical protein
VLRDFRLKVVNLTQVVTSSETSVSFFSTIELLHVDLAGMERGICEGR